MNYFTTWKVLEEMITDFRKKGMVVPAEIMSDLKSAKTLANILKADPNRIDVAQKVEEYLINVESYVVSEGEKTFGSKYVKEWLKRLDEAETETFEEKEKTKLVTGVPREHNWIRVKPSNELPIEKLKVLAEETNLSYNVQNDGCLLVYGKDKCIKEFIKKTAQRYGLKVKKQP